MLSVLCAICSLVNTEEELHQAMKQNKAFFMAHNANGQHFYDYVMSGDYDINQFKNLCASYTKYMAGDRQELKWSGSDWFSNVTCDNNTNPVCEFTGSETDENGRNTKYKGPTRNGWRFNSGYDRSEAIRIAEQIASMHQAWDEAIEMNKDFDYEAWAKKIEALEAQDKIDAAIAANQLAVSSPLLNVNGVGLVYPHGTQPIQAIQVMWDYESAHANLYGE